MKNCLVIGGGSDIGAAIVRELDLDYNVLWTFCHTERKDLPGKRFFCDMTNEKSIGELFQAIDDLDLVVMAAFPFMEGDSFDFQAYLDAEAFLRGHIFALTYAADCLLDKGRIINILGQCVERGLPGAAFYSAAFAFLHNWGNSVNGSEGKAGGMCVCDLLLGPVNTREWDGLSPEVVERYKAKVRNFIEPQQVAETVKFLAAQAVMPSTFKLDAYCGY
ncbi:MAG: hypothetical protein Q7K65_04620 [Candidatus Buchananbacteria bacterium]|nr:hypothetical protein [Candidatus Buchananbacteria bacterium]